MPLGGVILDGLLRLLAGLFRYLYFPLQPLERRNIVFRSGQLLPQLQIGVPCDGGHVRLPKPEASRTIVYAHLVYDAGRCSFAAHGWSSFLAAAAFTIRTTSSPS